jgi:hypothetical protein
MITALQKALLHTPWVLGVAGVVATWSYMSWYRHIPRWSIVDALGTPMFQTPLYASLTLFCLGLLLIEIVLPPQTLWRPGIWGLFGLFFAIQSVMSGRQWRQQYQAQKRMQDKATKL